MDLRLRQIFADSIIVFSNPGMGLKLA